MTVRRKKSVFVLRRYRSALHESVHYLGYGLDDRGIVINFPTGFVRLLCMQQRSDQLWGPTKDGRLLLLPLHSSLALCERHRDQTEISPTRVTAIKFS
jgi:hypothetical protein